jgi:hypothetical protein
VRGVIAPALLYCDDCNPSGLYMSEHDLAERLAQYGGDHIPLNSIALLRQQVKSPILAYGRALEPHPAVRACVVTWSSDWSLPFPDQ